VTVNDIHNISTYILCFCLTQRSLVGLWNCPAWFSRGQRPMIAGRVSLLWHPPRRPSNICWQCKKHDDRLLSNAIGRTKHTRHHDNDIRDVLSSPKAGASGALVSLSPSTCIHVLFFVASGALLFCIWRLRCLLGGLRCRRLPFSQPLGHVLDRSGTRKDPDDFLWLSSC